MTAKKPLAVSTMVYDDADCLKVWLRYWRGQLSERDLYVIIDGPNPELEAMAAGCQVIVRDRPEPHELMEEERWEMLSAFAADLLERYEVAVYSDVDEIIVVDPKSRRTVAEALTASNLPVRHTRGIELIHRRDLEPAEIDLDAPILKQRQYFRSAGYYSKPCILRQPVTWGRGGHYTNYRGLHVAPDLYTVHLRFFDIDLFLDRARRRRKTTESTEFMKGRRSRQWRNSDEGALSILKKLEEMPVIPGRWIITQSVTWRIWRTFPETPDENGIYIYYAHDSRVIQRLPTRFLDLF